MMSFGPINFLVESFMIPFLEFSYSTIFPNYGIAIMLTIKDPSHKGLEDFVNGYQAKTLIYQNQ